MGGGKGGSADQSGMYAAMASAQEADKMYALGEQQLQWTKDVYNQQWPTILASANAQMALEGQQQKSLQQMMNEAAQQWDTYQKDYLPEEEKLIGQVNDWASPGNQALVRGEAMGTIASQGQQGINTAAETLREYGLNPGARKYMSLYTEAQPMLAAAQAAAGTTASQNLKLQQLGLESGVINTGRGMVNATGALTTAGTGAGAAGANAAAGAGNTLEQNLATGSQAMSNPAQMFNAGTNAMNTYVGAVNGYNQSQADFAQAGASEMSGLGSAAGGVLGLLAMRAKGGPITKYDDGGSVGHGDDVPPMPSSNVTGPEWERQFKAHNDAIDRILRTPPARSVPRQDTPPTENYPTVGPMFRGPSMNTAKGGAINRYADGGPTGYAGGGMSPGAMPSAPSWGGGMPAWGGGTGLPPGGTPGGTVPVHASPSMGVATDDVPAMLTANEFVIPKDVATWIGHKALAGHIDKARKEQQAFSMRDDIGGEPTQGIPQHPTFVSRPDHAGGARGGWEAALGQGAQNWQDTLQGFENKLPQDWQNKIQSWQGGFPTG